MRRADRLGDRRVSRLAAELLDNGRDGIFGNALDIAHRLGLGLGDAGFRSGELASEVLLDRDALRLDLLGALVACFTGNGLRAGAAFASEASRAAACSSASFCAALAARRAPSIVSRRSSSTEPIRGNATRLISK